MRKVFVKVEVHLVVLADDGVDIEDVLDDMTYAFDLPADGRCELIDYHIDDYQITDSK